jgi:hypothetical protein
MTQKFLRRFEVHFRCLQVRGKRVAETMPPDCLARDLGPSQGRTNYLLELCVRRQRLFPSEPD